MDEYLNTMLYVIVIVYPCHVMVSLINIADKKAPNV